MGAQNQVTLAPTAARGGVMEREGVAPGSWMGPCAHGLRRGVFDPVTLVQTPIVCMWELCP